MKWPELCKLARELPEVTVGTWYATPGLLVAGKGFVRLITGPAKPGGEIDGTTVVFMLADLDEQDALLHAKPAVYYITDHYQGYPAILARLGKLGVREARTRLERSWQQKAPKRLLR
ncbi:MAG TPA: hypothetical protein VGG28_09550 [Kofleriaceae bacterium]|jgi:hypothetical protein